MKYNDIGVQSLNILVKRIPTMSSNLKFFQKQLGNLNISRFYKKIEPGDIPEWVHTISIGENFDLIQPGAIPNHVVSVNILCKFYMTEDKKDIILKKGYLPKNLQQLAINNTYDGGRDCVEVRIDDMKDLKCLTYLKITGDVKCDLAEMLSSCPSITNLSVSFNSDYDIYCPDSLLHLSIVYEAEYIGIPFELPYPVKNLDIFSFKNNWILEDREVYFKVPKEVQKIRISNLDHRNLLIFERGTEEFDRRFETFELVKSAVE